MVVCVVPFVPCQACWCVDYRNRNKKTWEHHLSAHPTLHGSGIARFVRTSNAEAHADTFGTGKVCADDCLEMAIPLVFGLTPKQIVDTLRLTRPIFRQTAAFGHFGRKELPWERTDKVEQLRNTVI